MNRMLEPGGRILVYVWAKEQHREKEMSSYLKQNKNNFKKKVAPEPVEPEIGEFGLPVHLNRTDFIHQVGGGWCQLFILRTKLMIS